MRPSLSRSLNRSQCHVHRPLKQSKVLSLDFVSTNVKPLTSEYLIEKGITEESSNIGTCNLKVISPSLLNAVVCIHRNHSTRTEVHLLSDRSLQSCRTHEDGTHDGERRQEHRSRKRVETPNYTLTLSFKSFCFDSRMTWNLFVVENWLYVTNVPKTKIKIKTIQRIVLCYKF